MLWEVEIGAVTDSPGGQGGHKSNSVGWLVLETSSDMKWENVAGRK